MSAKRIIPWMIGLGSVFASVFVFMLSTWLSSTDRDHGPGGLGPYVRWLRQSDLFQRIELVLYDLRVKRAVSNGEKMDSSLGLILFDEETILDLRLGMTLDERMHPLYPRSIYARVLRELRTEGAEAVAFDIQMPDAFYDRQADDAEFAREIRASGNVILGAVTNAAPFYKFRFAGAELGGVDAPKDVDGSGRRVRAFADCEFVSALLAKNLRLQTPPQEIVQIDRERHIITTADLADTRTNLQASLHSIPYEADETVVIRTPRAKIAVPIFDHPRVWHLGIVLAAKKLGLDLESAEVSRNNIILRGTNGVERIIPIDAHGYFSVDWTAPVLKNSNLNNASMYPGGIVGLDRVLRLDRERTALTNSSSSLPAPWKGMLVVIGSVANGNNMGDIGSTPLATLDAMVSTYPNVANSILHNRFVHRLNYFAESSLVALVTAVAAFATWKLRPIYSLSVLLLVSLGLLILAFSVFSHFRLWLPLAHPIAGALLFGFPPMITYRALFSQREQQRVTAFFAKLVSPNVVQELLKLEHLALGGARREMTVFFADVRGFTEMTDRYQADAEEYVRTHKLDSVAAEAHFEAKASEVLATVNQYLAAIADVVKSRGGTLDKYIGDCVMAFWGAPTPNPQHAVDSVIAAIEAQRAIARLNEKRTDENAKIEAQNVERLQRKEAALPLLPLLSLGSGLNTGIVTVGTMGSDQHGLNYTVFGRDVNLASRLEGVSGKSRIVIGETTHLALQTLAPELAGLCIALEPVPIKGFRQPIQAYEVLWRDASESFASPERKAARRG